MAEHGGARRRLEVDDERFKALWVAGTPLLQIAALFGGTKSWASLHARRLGLEPRQTSTGKLPGAAIAIAYKEGHSLRAIRKALLPKWPKVSERTIAATLRGRGVKLRPRRVSPHKLDVPAIIRLARANYSDSRIADHFKVGRQVIQRIRRRTLDAART